MIEPTFKIKEEKSTVDYGEFVIEPLEPGYGHTLGNALRRVLLVSISGAAVTSVKISGVKHKFSTIPGLKENVVDFLLNIKGLNLRLLDSKEQSTVTLSVKGPKEITAKDLNLKPISVSRVSHADGTSLANVYLVNIYLPNNLIIPSVRVTECADSAGNFGVIIGMDVITMGDFSITNENNKTIVSFRIPSIKTIDYVQEVYDLRNR